MLRLIALVLVTTSWAHGAPPTESKPLDFSVSPEEHALRDLFPGWTPCRALTEDEMIRPESPYSMEIGSYPRSAPPKLIIPVVPTDWTDNWPEPAPLAATGVPRGWWWMPEDPKWFGAWVVLGQGKAGRSHHFFTLVTTPLRAVDYGRFERVEVVQGIYAGLLAQVAKARGVDAAELDKSARRLIVGSDIPSYVDSARARAKELVRRDEIEQGGDLLASALDDGAGADRLRAKAFMELSAYRYAIGEPRLAVAALESARLHAEGAGLSSFIKFIDEQLAGMRAELPIVTPATKWAIRATSSLDRGYADRALDHARVGLEKLSPNDQESELALRRVLVRTHLARGDRAAAEDEVERGVALARKLGDPDAEKKLVALMSTSAE